MRTTFYKFINIIKYINIHPLARRHKFISYFKLIKWQLAQYINPRERIVSFTNKTFLAVSKGMTGATGNIYLGLHEFNDMGFLLHFLREGDVFFDIGANIGSYTILASGHCKAKTICFEPIKTTFKTLQKNINLNQLHDLAIAKNMGLGELKSMLTFTNSMDTVNHVVTASDNSRHVSDVAVYPADFFLNDYDCPALVKIDVEGYEAWVLKGMPIILKNTNLKAVIIELNGSGYKYDIDEIQIHAALLKLNFQPYDYNPFTRILTPLKSFGTANTIYIREISFVEIRVKNADKIHLFSESF